LLTQRPVDLITDREFLLDLACLASYENLPVSYRQQSYPGYRRAWVESHRPQSFLDRLQTAIGDSRTVAEIWLEDGQRIGLLWLSFEDSPQRQITATLNGLVVSPSHRRRGIGTMMLQAVERMAREGQAAVLRVETSIDNEWAQMRYQNAGFTVAGLLYEKVLEGGDV
jgi:ribosomal protein S18 acetylase RimI-like enzyme